jgi:hypothetical protein
MPGVKVVEEPGEDLWFEPNQCPTVEEIEELQEEGYLGLGDFYDPVPWLTQEEADGYGIVDPRGLPRDVAYELEYDPEEDPAERREYDWNLERIISNAPEPIQEDIRDKIFYLSANTKTGISFNIRIQGYFGHITPGVAEERRLRTIPGTCRPTQWCTGHCYAKLGHFVTWQEQDWRTLSRQQRRYLQNLIVSQLYTTAPQKEVDAQADAIVDYIRSKMHQFPAGAPPNIRWNGSGDFNPGTSRIINAITKRHPDFILWGFSRKGTTGERLVRRPNLRILFSTDETTPPFGRAGDNLDTLAEASMKLWGGFSYATAVPYDSRLFVLERALQKQYQGRVRVETVFGYHCGVKHTEIGSAQECAATNPRIFASCQKCRWCMMSRDDKQLEGVDTPAQAFYAHEGEPDEERIEGRGLIPLEQEEAFAIYRQF